MRNVLILQMLVEMLVVRLASSKVPQNGQLGGQKLKATKQNHLIELTSKQSAKPIRGATHEFSSRNHSAF
jgi:hypothetical protein